jgi:hypothetical protein
VLAIVNVLEMAPDAWTGLQLANSAGAFASTARMLSVFNARGTPMPDKLTEFLRARTPQPDLKQRAEWLDAIRKLYVQIKDWLSEAKAEGLVDYGDADVAITESTLGTYDAPVLQLRFGERMMHVRPVGRFVIGAKGRIDMLLGPNQAMMIRAADETWKIVPVGSTRDQLVSLTKDTFTEAIEALLG